MLNVSSVLPEFLQVHSNSRVAAGTTIRTLIDHLIHRSESHQSEEFRSKDDSLDMLFTFILESYLSLFHGDLKLRYFAIREVCGDKRTEKSMVSESALAIKYRSRKISKDLGHYAGNIKKNDSE